jgi:hypothetical protein
MSNMVMLMLLRRMDRGDITAHGFRSSFSDWAAERTAYPREVVEMALAHAVENKVEAAYRRGDLFEKRRLLMEDWARFSTAESSPEIGLDIDKAELSTPPPGQPSLSAPPVLADEADEVVANLRRQLAELDRKERQPLLDAPIPPIMPSLSGEDVIASLKRQLDEMERKD